MIILVENKKRVLEKREATRIPDSPNIRKQKEFETGLGIDLGKFQKQKEFET